MCVNLICCTADCVYSKPQTFHERNKTSEKKRERERNIAKKIVVQKEVNSIPSKFKEANMMCTYHLKFY